SSNVSASGGAATIGVPGNGDSHFPTTPPLKPNTTHPGRVIVKQDAASGASITSLGGEIDPIKTDTPTPGAATPPSAQPSLQLTSIVTPATGIAAGGGASSGSNSSSFSLAAPTTIASSKGSSPSVPADGPVSNTGVGRSASDSGEGGNQRGAAAAKGPA